MKRSNQWLLAVSFIGFSPFCLLASMNLLMEPQKSGTIQHLSIKDKSGLTENGMMNIPFLKRLLKQAFEEGVLTYEPFKHPESLKLKKLTEAEEEAPWGTTQIFLIESAEHSFILKGMKEKDKNEVAELTRSLQIPGLTRYRYPTGPVGYPQFIFPLTYLSYTDTHNRKQYLSLMPTAPGLSLSYLFKKFANDPSHGKTHRAVSQAYFDVGAAMANFYKVTHKKITQGDLHHGNIFYDAATRLVTLIDNECVAMSSENPSLSRENAFLLLKSLFVVKWTDGKLLKDLPIEAWYNLYLPSYIVGYLSAFPEGERQRIYTWLKGSLKKYVSDDKEPKNWYSDKSILHFSHQDFMDRVFENLEEVKILFAIEKETVNTRDDHGKTLLHKAAAAGHWRIMWPLIACGGDVEIRDNDGNTPLHEASYYGHSTVIKILKKAGAEINAQNFKGVTPLGKALSNKSNEAVELLKSFKAH